MTNVNLEELMKLKVAARKLGLHINTVRSEIHKGKLQAIKLGRGYKVSPEALDAYIKGQFVGAK